MELTSVVQLIYQATKRLDKIQREIFKLAEKKAMTESAYRQKLAEEMMRLRVEKIPTTLIPDMARGNTSDLKLERDLAEGTYKSALSAMEALKVEINALQSVAKYQNEVGS
ncbi:hypothetical protein [Pseudobacillus badius]|uniref:hypothetical protein n=1 Tax=Bacillus badius TaxID=1455 RepID=UPI0024A2672D|nr:hypothetical protein [Bacillus badius]GLY11392.1 phage protein [Bacillus badius]